MQRAWTVAEIRVAEGIRLAEVPDGALMQRAAAGLAAVCGRELRARYGGVSGRRVVLLVGAGNNGGDALYAGQRLAGRGARVDAVLLAGQDRVHAAGLAALRAAGGRVGEPQGGIPADTHLVVDGVVGIGGSLGLRPTATELAAQVPDDACVVAIDLPSGVDPDTGELPDPDGEGRRRHVAADVTVTFGAYKGCLLLPPASAAAGRVALVDIGLGPLLTSRPLTERLEAGDAAALWPVPTDRIDEATHKYTRGVLGVCAGSDTFPGAGVLAVAGAMRAGAGMVRYVGPAEVTRAVLAAWPEAVPGAGRVQAWLVGSGLDPVRASDDGQLAAAEQAIGAARAGGPPALVDAGALALLAARGGVSTGVGGRAGTPSPMLLTPHAGELAALLTALGRTTRREQVEASPLQHARSAAELIGATVLLKGSTTLVVEPPAGSGPARVRSQADATPWLATAGAGDVLAGVAGALLAAGLDPLDAGSLAALVHGRAARAASSGGPIIARDVADSVPRAVRDLLG